MSLNEIFYKIFANIPTQNGFSMFDWQHFVLLIFQVVLPLVLAILLSKKTEQTKDKIIKAAAYTVIILYIADFFVQPFWAGSMIVNKLPFHICTATGVLLTFVTFNKKFESIKIFATVWAILAPLMWMLFPFSTYHTTSVFSYSTMQSIIYHSAEFFWGVFMLTSGKTQLKWSTIWQPIAYLLPLALWATFGQELYFPNTVGENFMMLRTDVSGIVPHYVYLLALFVGAVLAVSLLYLLYNVVIKVKNKKNKTQ